MEPDSPCTIEFRERQDAIARHIQEQDLSEVAALLDEEFDAFFELNIDEYEEVWSPFTTPTPKEGDLEGWVEYEMESYQFRRQHMLGKVDAKKLIADVPEIANEVCNSRGLYK